MSFAYPPTQGPPSQEYPSLASDIGHYPPAAPSGHSSRFPIYQIDFTAQSAGKRIATTKRRIRWRWGFTNKKALEEGLTGTACRGEEHDVTIVWSVTSGKRQITMDGQEVHFSTNRSSVLDFSWSMRGNHVMKIMAHATPPLSATVGFRQYDLSIDGQSFFLMPKVFELGLRGAPQAVARNPGDTGHYRIEGSSRGGSEDNDIQRAIQLSLEESRRHLNRGGNDGNSYSGSSRGYSANQIAPVPAPTASQDNVDLLGFDSAAPAPPPAQYITYDSYSQPPPAPYGQTPPAQMGAMVPYGQPTGYGPPAPAPYAQPPTSYAQPPSPYAQPPPFGSPQSYGNGYQSSFSPDAQSFASAPNPLLAPVQHSYDDPFAPKAAPPPTQYDIHNAILGAYAPPSTPTGAAPSQPDFGTPQNGAASQVATPTFSTNSTTPVLSMSAPLALTVDGEDSNKGPVTELEKAMQNLVNFDDLTAPAEKAMRLTMMKQEEEKMAIKKSGKSRGLPPVAKGLVGSGATLGQIQNVKTGTTLKDPSEIMKAPPQLFHPDSVHAGALVIHGQGPPPLQRGFGVGFGAVPYNR